MPPAPDSYISQQRARRHYFGRSFVFTAMPEVAPPAAFLTFRAYCTAHFRLTPPRHATPAALTPLSYRPPHD